jgi:acetylserotonin N-methyltransferase
MTPELTVGPHTDPTLLYRYRDALYAADLFIAGLHLDFFSWLGTHPSTLAGVCAAHGFAERPADVMLTLFSAMGLIQQHDGMFTLTETGREHLTGGSPWNLKPYYPSLADRPIARDLLEVLRTGKPANWAAQGAGKDWHRSMESEEFAASFTAAMDCRGLYLAQSLAAAIDLRRHRQLLDIGGGSGVYACVLAAHNPHLRAAVLDKPPVDRIASTAITKRGLADRVSVIARDMLAEPFPTGSDVHLYSNVLHDWDRPVVEELLRKSYAALPAGGLVVVHEAFLNAEKTGPLHVAEYSVLLMHASEGRCYSVAEMERYLSAAKFSSCSYVSGSAARGMIIARK